MKLGDFIDVEMAIACIIHGAEEVKIHGTSPLFGVPNLANNAIFRNFGVNMNVLAYCRVCPVLFVRVSTCTCTVLIKELYLCNQCTGVIEKVNVAQRGLARNG